MNPSNEEKFVDLATKYKYKWKSIFYYGIIFMTISIILFLTIMFLKLMLFSSSKSIHVEYISQNPNYISNQNYNSNYNQNSNVNLNLNKIQNQAPYDNRMIQCNKNMMADVTRNCLSARFKKPIIFTNNENERYNQCMNSLTMNPYITKIIKEYIDMIKEDICLNPELTNQKSTQWFNTPIETIIYNDV